MFLKCDLQIWKVEGCVFAGVGPQSSVCFSFLPLFLTLPDLVMSLLLAFDSVKKIAELLGSHFLILLQTDFSKPKSCLSLNCQSAFGRGGSERWELLPGCGHCTFGIKFLLSTASSPVRLSALELSSSFLIASG